MLAQISQQFSGFWKQQSAASRVVFVVLVALGVVLVPLFLIWAQNPSYDVAFSGLSESDAGQIVDQLNEEGIEYKLQGSGTILVPSDKVYDVRISMAQQGLPESSTVGFEVFSGSTLGMTEFTQRINYQQALEGELERTIGSLASIEAVRVHIVIPEDTLLASQQAPTTASVTVKEKAGTNLDSGQVSAITHLLASSVEGLDSENVVVVDISGNMYTSGESGGSTLAQTDSRRAAEAAAANEVKNKVQVLLDSALGPNKSIVQANVTLDWTERQTVTQAVNPEKTAILSSQSIMEVYTTTSSTVEGVPGATSNLPPAASGTESGSGGIQYERNETTNNYEITHVQSEEVYTPGGIERISLSVLVDGVTDETQLATLETVIAAAAGIDETRGDLFAVESLEFDRTYYETQSEELESTEKQDLYFKIGEGVLAGLIVIALLWYVQRMLSKLRLASTEAWTPVMKPVSELGLPMPGMRPQVAGTAMGEAGQLEAAISGKGVQASEAEVRQKAQAVMKPLPKIELPSVSPEYEQLQKTLEGIAEDDPASLAEAIQLWLNEDERHNG
ncbi:MAG: flagellar M-ring protein FliF [Anaerolineales bacterium]|nr:flagellar M-ring protein FliF [Anaerolineales bacterium]